MIAFEMFGLRILCEDCKWVLKIAEIKRRLLENVKKKKLSYFGHMMGKCGSLEKEILSGRIPGQRY